MLTDSLSESQQKPLAFGSKEMPVLRMGLSTVPGFKMTQYFTVCCSFYLCFICSHNLCEPLRVPLLAFYIRYVIISFHVLTFTLQMLDEQPYHLMNCCQ